MNAWNGAGPPVSPPWTLLDRSRLILRGGLAILMTAILFAIFLALRGIDILAGRLGARPLAPFVVQAWAVAAIPLLGLRFRRIGTPMRQPGAIVANHASWIDIVTLSRAAPVFFVSKAEVSRWPVIGFIGRRIGTEFIERRAIESRRQTEALALRLHRGDRLCLFPEGTSTDGQRVLHFNSTLFQIFYPDGDTPLRVQPVSIFYRPRKDLPRDFYGWWGDMDFATHLTSVLALSSGGEVTVQFHPPLDTADFAGRKPLAERSQALVAEGFDELQAPRPDRDSKLVAIVKSDLTI